MQMAEFQGFRQKMEDASQHPFPSPVSSGMNFPVGGRVLHPQQQRAHTTQVQQQPNMPQTTFPQVHASSNASPIGARKAGNVQDATNPQLGGHGLPPPGGDGVRAHIGLGLSRQNAQQFMDQLAQVHMLPGDGGADSSSGAGKGDQYNGIGDPNLHAALADIQQKIERMQELVRMNHGEGGQANLHQQQQVASAVSLISQVTAAIHEGMLNQNQRQNLSMSDSSQLNHLFGACSSAAGFNFFEQHFTSSPAVNADMVVGNNNAFLSLPGRLLGGNNDDHHQSANNPMAFAPTHNSLRGNLSASSGDRVYGAVTTGKGSSVLPSETVGVGNLRHPQIDNRLNSRVAAVSGMNVSSAKTAINRSSPGATSNSAGSGSQGSDEQEMKGVRSSRGQQQRHAQRDEYDDGEGEVLVAGSYQLVELDDQEILAEHTHFCDLCGKGFKRDANLRMHMRSHGDEYKTPEALARPPKPLDELQTPVIPKRFSCPHVGCKRNVKHRKFQPLKSLLCVKNHYRRSHCAKNLACSKCKVKRFSVVADLKTHEKHCGCDKWQCSCGTTFSRKDKLFGHVSLFVGHSPAALPLPDSLPESSGGSALDIVDMATVVGAINVDNGATEFESTPLNVQKGPDNQVSAGGFAHWTQQLF